MTRQQMQIFALQLLQAATHGAMEGNPFISDPLLDQAADDMTEATDCNWRRITMDLTANQAPYCAPPIYKLKAVYAIGDDGNEYELNRRNMRDMDELFGHRRWTTWNTCSQPSNAIALAKNRIQLAPAPSVSRTGGLIFAGFARSTDNSPGQQMHQWPNPTDECPLPQESHMGIVFRYNYYRLLQMLAGTDAPPNTPALMKSYDDLYEESKGRLEDWSRKQYSEERIGDAFGISGWY